MPKLTTPRGDQPASSMTIREKMAMYILASLICSDSQNDTVNNAKNAADALLKELENEHGE